MADIITVVDALTNTQIEREATAEEQAVLDADKLDNENNKFSNAMEVFRNKRNLLLVNSDWTQMPDSPLTDAQKTEWQTYRQSLRDLTNGLTTVEDIDAVIFPTKPTENN